MKLFLLTISIFLSIGAPPGYAQIRQGMIEYEYTIDVHRNLPPEREELKAMIPQFRTVTYQLLFNGEESLYKIKENPEEEATGRPGGMMRMGRMSRTETHIDRVGKVVTVLQDFIGKNYLITEPLAIAPWKISHQQMDIEGYVCMMAWYNDTIQNQEITAWFTPQIQPFLGPDRYVSLPGTVLALDINNGERVWVARSIVDMDVESSDLRKPNRGEAITREDFIKLVEEQTQRMNTGGGGFRF